MHIVRKKCKRDGNGLHFVIICDEAGIFDAFDFTKSWLGAGMGTAFISLIYTISDKNTHPLFNQELNILEKRLMYNLIVHISRIDTTKYCFNQELLEATINSNTFPNMKFFVFGNTEFVNHVSGVLKFLDVKGYMINSKIL
jgi:hypothetical protein